MLFVEKIILVTVSSGSVHNVLFQSHFVLSSEDMERESFSDVNQMEQNWHEISKLFPVLVKRGDLTTWWVCVCVWVCRCMWVCVVCVCLCVQRGFFFLYGFQGNASSARLLCLHVKFPCRSSNSFCSSDLGNFRCFFFFFLNIRN